MPGSRFPRRRRDSASPDSSIALVSELNLILLGPPGAGKGTQAERLQDDFPIAYVATGDMLRQAVKDGTGLGREAKAYMDRGDLVPDGVITGVIIDAVKGSDCEDGFLLDGFPRTVAQAESLDEGLQGLDRSLSAVLLIDVPEDEVVRRLSGRRVCPQGHVYHVEHNPPRQEGVCDIDGTRLSQRDDDREDTIRHRLDVYADQTSPLIGYYGERGLLRGIDAMGPVEDVTERAINALRRFER